MSENRLEVVARLRDEMSSVLSTINGNMGRMATVAEANFARVGRTISAVRLAVAGVAGSKAVAAALGEAAALDRAQMQLEAVLGDAEKAAAALERLKTIPVTKFFGTDEIVQAFIRLQSIGIPAAEQAVAQIRNIAVIFNTDLSTAVDAFVSGKANSLSKLGIGVQKVGDQIALTSGNIRVVTDDTAAAMRAGVLEVWEKAFPNAADKAATLFEQKMAVLRSSVMDVAGDVGQAFLPVLKQWADAAIEMVDRHRSTISAVAQSTGEILSLTADFFVQKLDATIFSTEFWSRLPVLTEQAFAGVISGFTRMLVVMGANWDVWVPTLVLTFEGAFQGLFGGILVGIQRLTGQILQALGRLPANGLIDTMAPGFKQGLEGLGKLVEEWVPKTEAAVQTSVQYFLDGAVDNADAALGLLDARLEKFRQDHGGMSLIEDGMSLVGAASDTSGATALLQQIQAVIGKNRELAEARRAALAKVDTSTPSPIQALGEDTEAATGKVKKLRTEAEQMADRIRDAFDAIGDRLGPSVDLADAQVQLMRAKMDAALRGGAGAGEQDANAEALRGSMRAQIDAELAVAQAKMAVLQGEPGQETAAAALATDVARLRTELAALNAESAQMQNPGTALAAGLKDGLSQLEMTTEKWREFASGSVVEVATAIRSGIVDNIMAATKGMQSWGEAGRKAALQLAEALQRVVLEMIAVAAQQAAMDAARSAAGWITKAIGLVVGAAGGAAASGGGGSPATLPDLYSQPALATGGVVFGGLSPIPRAAMGAIFTGPQLAVVGDNPSRVEAAVPMPNGREIPVQLKGGAGGDSYHFSIQALDARSVRDMLVSEEGTIVSILRNAVESRPSVRRAIRGQ